jgi:hypothetical protein
MTRPWHSAALWLGLFVGLAEVAAALWSPYREIPRASQAIRNPSMTRGWPEYTAGPKNPPRDLVVLITHSQGVGREHSDPNVIYPTAVRQSLAQRADFESWACGGLRTPEIEALVVQAVRRKARLVILALAPTNLDPLERLSLRYPSTDAPLLVFDPVNWALARRTLAWHHTSAADLLALAGKRWSALLRSRSVFEDALSEELPPELAPIAFGRRVPPVERLDDLARPGSAYWGPPTYALLAFREEQRQKGRAVRHYSAEDIEARLATFRLLAARLRALSRDRGPELLWVFTPFDHSRVSSETLSYLGRFFGEAKEILDEHEFPHVDFHSLVPQARFVTAGHLDEAGHGLFATAMTQAIEHALR